MCVSVHICLYTSTYVQMNPYILKFASKFIKLPIFPTQIYQSHKTEYFNFKAVTVPNIEMDTINQIHKICCVLNCLYPFTYYLNKRWCHIFKLRVRNLTRHNIQSPLPSRKAKVKIEKILVLLFVLHECSNLLLLLIDIDGVSLTAVLNTIAIKGCPGGCRLSIR